MLQNEDVGRPGLHAYERNSVPHEFTFLCVRVDPTTLLGSYFGGANVPLQLRQALGCRRRQRCYDCTDWPVGACDHPPPVAVARLRGLCMSLRRSPGRNTRSPRRRGQHQQLSD